jgi:hypothetical protein
LSDFKGRIEKLHYDISAGMYVSVKAEWMKQNGFLNELGEAQIDFYWLVQEKKYPHDWMIVSAENYLPTAIDKFYSCLTLHKDAINTKQYKGISHYSDDANGIFRPTPAPWNKQLNKML